MPGSANPMVDISRTETEFLHCYDYWLQFDGDDDDDEEESPKQLEFDNLTSPTPDGLLDSIQPGLSMGTGFPYQTGIPTQETAPWEDSEFGHVPSGKAGSDPLMPGQDLTQSPDGVLEGLYSPCLSWEATQPDFGVNPYSLMNPSLDVLERQRLLAIAIRPNLAVTTAGPLMRPCTDFDSEPSPTSASVGNTPSHRRKSSDQEISSKAPKKVKEKSQNSGREAHNNIERKYRMSLKDKIAELREAVPMLSSTFEEHDDDGFPVPVSSAPIVNKSTVLIRATEHIRRLERRNRKASNRTEELLRRIKAFEQLIGVGPAPSWMPQDIMLPHSSSS